MAERQPFGLLTEADLIDDLDEALVSERVKAKLEELFASLDLKQGLRRLAYRGFDSWEDYEKYGDMYVALDVRPRSTGTR